MILSFKRLRHTAALVFGRIRVHAGAPDAGLSFILRTSKSQETKLCLIIVNLPVSNTGSFVEEGAETSEINA